MAFTFMAAAAVVNVEVQADPVMLPQVCVGKPPCDPPKVDWTKKANQTEEQARTFARNHPFIDGLTHQSSYLYDQAKVYRLMADVQRGELSTESKITLFQAGAMLLARPLAAKGIGPVVGGGAKLENLTAGEITRIQNAANRTGTPITVVGSRANGTAQALSDWDYAVPATTSKRTVHSLSSSLPEGARGLGEGRSQDFFRSAVDPNKPFITFTPNEK